MNSDSSFSIHQYAVVTGNYWAFTLTDGALRMLVVLYFYQLNYSPLQIAFLFLFYEIFGVFTNLIGGWLGTRIGLNRTMNIGLGLQLIALAMLLVPTSLLTVVWVMVSQALSGIAKDLNKMSAKSSIKFLAPKGQNSTLFSWIAILTGSKNALKGLGFFLGALLLSLIEFHGAVGSMIVLLCIAFICSLIFLKKDLGKAKTKTKFTQIFSNTSIINILAAARLFLFAARDVWFVVALPVYFSSQLEWDHWKVGSFFAIWIIAYGFVQAVVPKIYSGNTTPTMKSAGVWAVLLALIPCAIAIGLNSYLTNELTLIIGLSLFGVLFAINSSIHSYLIVCFSRDDGVSLDVGFYYMANALGRLLGTVLSGWLYQEWGLQLCIIVSSIMLVFSGIVSFFGIKRC